MKLSSEKLGRFFSTHHARFDRCLEPTMECSNPAIRAHSIQNARVIDLLADKGHVVALRLDFSEGVPEIAFRSIGRNSASTFTGLCGEHDRNLFTPIDTRPLNLADREQLFLLAYRSVTRELHAVMEGAAKVQGAYISRVERGVDPANEMSPAGLFATEQLMNAFVTYEYRRINFDGSLLASAFDAVEHDVIEMNNLRPTIAVSSLFSLDQVVSGDDIVRVVLNVLPVDETRSVAIFSYTKQDAGKARAALDRVLAAQGDHQKYELSRLILSAIENFLIAPAHFATWNASKRERIRQAFASTVMVGTEPSEHPDLMLFA